MDDDAACPCARDAREGPGLPALGTCTAALGDLRTEDDITVDDVDAGRAVDGMDIGRTFADGAPTGNVIERCCTRGASPAEGAS